MGFALCVGLKVGGLAAQGRELGDAPAELLGKGRDILPRARNEAEGRGARSGGALGSRARARKRKCSSSVGTGVARKGRAGHQYDLTIMI